ncbi:unnamed protein product [Linum trigynum]|uniref:Uncharacterized protein n=1 Tax=Linum trigynum TaxID=586398 RepID=A0AAV2GMG4_9ROSI
MMLRLLLSRSRLNWGSSLVSSLVSPEVLNEALEMVSREEWDGSEEVMVHMRYHCLQCSLSGLLGLLLNLFLYLKLGV